MLLNRNTRFYGCFRVIYSWLVTRVGPGSGVSGTDDAWPAYRSIGCAACRGEPKGGMRHWLHHVSNFVHPTVQFITRAFEDPVYERTSSAVRLPVLLSDLCLLTEQKSPATDTVTRILRRRPSSEQLSSRAYALPEPFVPKSDRSRSVSTLLPR